ncbi:MAG: colanic acid biosynthesis glycosyltransferase WcaL [Anaerolineales bacterium]|nr:MAG: colanic acid biosynthesis glycosyltransferase WcaL [Anaerolineales bacterium]
MDTTCYIFPISWPRFLQRHIYFLLTRPINYIGTALFVLTRPGESWKNRLRTVYHFGEAVYLAKEVQQRNIQHLHAHFTINAASIALIVARLLNISFSFTAHNIFFTDRLLLKEKVRESRFIAVISRFSQEYLLRLVPGESWRGKTHIVHCGISPGQFSPPYPRPANIVPFIFFVSQLEERKGALYLIEACRLLKGRGVSFQCVLAGDGPQKPIIQRLIDQYGLKEIVDLPGAIFIEQVRDYLNQADIFVLPCIVARNGDMDGIPVALMEAMACEIAVVSTRVSGIPELIQDGESGLLVSEKDAIALADAIQRLIEDKELCLQLGKNGRQKVMREFDVDGNASQLAKLFESCLLPGEKPPTLAF